jgi:hypothetical protein
MTPGWSAYILMNLERDWKPEWHHVGFSVHSQVRAISGAFEHVCSFLAPMSNSRPSGDIGFFKSRRNDADEHAPKYAFSVISSTSSAGGINHFEDNSQD